MATIRMMQGDSYPVFIKLTVNEQTLTPDMVAEVEVSVGAELRYLYSAGQVQFDAELGQWFVLPTQAETLSLDVDSHEVQARVKFPNDAYSSVKGVSTGYINIIDATSEEAI